MFFFFSLFCIEFDRSFFYSIFFFLFNLSSPLARPSFFLYQKKLTGTACPKTPSDNNSMHKKNKTLPIISA